MRTIYTTHRHPENRRGGTATLLITPHRSYDEAHAFAIRVIEGGGVDLRQFEARSREELDAMTTAILGEHTRYCGGTATTRDPSCSTCFHAGL